MAGWSTPDAGASDIEPNDHRGGEDVLSSEISVLFGKRVFRWNDSWASDKIEGFYIEYPVGIELKPGQCLVELREQSMVVLVKNH